MGTNELDVIFLGAYYTDIDYDHKNFTEPQILYTSNEKEQRKEIEMKKIICDELGKDNRTYMVNGKRPIDEIKYRVLNKELKEIKDKLARILGWHESKGKLREMYHEFRSKFELAKEMGINEYSNFKEIYDHYIMMVTMFSRYLDKQGMMMGKTKDSYYISPKEKGWL